MVDQKKAESTPSEPITITIKPTALPAPTIAEKDKAFNQLATDNSVATAALLAANKLENDKKKAEQQKQISSTLDTLRRTSDVSRYSLYGIEFNPAFAAFINTIGTGLTLAAATTLNIGRIVGSLLLDAIPITRGIIRGSVGLWRLATRENPNDGIYTRAIKAVVDLTVLTTAILGCCFPPLAITITLTSIAASTARDIWIFGAGVMSRRSGSWRREIDAHEADKAAFYDYLTQMPAISYTEAGQQKTLTSSELLIKIRQGNDPVVSLINPTVVDKIRTWDNRLTANNRRLMERDVDLGRKLHNVIFGATALIGAALLFTPAAPIGALLLVATSIYGILHKYDFPSNWASKISKKLFGEPKPIPIDTIDKEITQRKQQPRPHNTETDILKQIRAESPSPASTPSKDISDTISLLTEPTPLIAHSLPTPKSTLDEREKSDTNDFSADSPSLTTHSLPNLTSLLDRKDDEDESDGDHMRKRLGP